MGAALRALDDQMEKEQIKQLGKFCTKFSGLKDECVNTS
jgi:hypothetical protein